MERRTDYRSIAPVFDRRYQDHNYNGVEHALRAFLAEIGLDVLDVGCGTGYWLTRLALPKTRIIGLDPSAEMLGQAKHSGRLELVQAQAEALPFETGSFDRVFCVNSFHHFAEKHVFIAEARRVLRAGGGFITVSLDPHTGLDKWWIYDYFENSLELDRYRYVSGKAICEMLNEAGFSDCRTDLVQCLAAAVSARRSLERGDVARTATSQLAILRDDEYRRGLQRLQEDIITAERRGQELLLLVDLRLYGTTGWLR